eukprot:4319479-Amphidinium_carterae.1
METMDTMETPQAHVYSATTHTQSRSSSESSTTNDRSTIDRKQVVSPQCRPMVLEALQWSWYIETMGYYKCSMDMLTLMADISSTRPIDKDSFIPTNFDNDTSQYLW